MKKARLGLKDLDHKSVNFAPPPCFVSSSHGPAAGCKKGQALCRACLDRLPEVEYPLPSPLPSGIMRTIDTYLTLKGAYPAT